MFTGIVETMGVVSDVSEDDGGRRLSIVADAITADLDVGDSVAVHGACLTATGVEETGFTTFLVSETLRRTSLGELRVGDRVNLERAMPANGRFDGHIVQGHVDGVGTVHSIRPDGQGRRLSIRCPEHLLRYVVEKGSVTINGVSLTVASVDGDKFDIALIPHTLESTTFGDMEAPAPVNLEVDILAKYVERLMEARA